MSDTELVRDLGEPGTAVPASAEYPSAGLFARCISGQDQTADQIWSRTADVVGQDRSEVLRAATRVDEVFIKALWYDALAAHGDSALLQCVQRPERIMEEIGARFATALVW